MLSKNIFITGTDTDIGKSVVSKWLCVHLKLVYWKIIQCGNLHFSDTDFIKNKSSIETLKSSYCFELPVSPHLASENSKEKIALKKICADYSEFDKIYGNSILIEGAGGLMVPCADNLLMIDIIKNLNAEVILVAKDQLGVLNHIGLSIEILKNKNIPLLGVILNGNSNLNNKEAIQKYFKTKVLEQIPTIEDEDFSEKKLLNISLKSDLLNNRY